MHSGVDPCARCPKAAACHNTRSHCASTMPCKRRHSVSRVQLASKQLQRIDQAAQSACKHTRRGQQLPNLRALVPAALPTGLPAGPSRSQVLSQVWDYASAASSCGLVRFRKGRQRLRCGQAGGRHKRKTCHAPLFMQFPCWLPANMSNVIKSLHRSCTQHLCSAVRWLPVCVGMQPPMACSLMPPPKP
jgi:hypothetical protein